MGVFTASQFPKITANSGEENIHLRRRRGGFP